MNGYTVSVANAPPRPIAAVRARLRAESVPAQFARHLDHVYAARAAGVRLDGQNVFVYRAAPDGEVDVEFGVGALAPFAPTGAVTFSATPGGEVAATTHVGDYAGLGRAHDAVVAWCRAHGRRLAGPRWEIYGHWSDDPAARRTDVCYLLAADSTTPAA